MITTRFPFLLFVPWSFSLRSNSLCSHPVSCHFRGNAGLGKTVCRPTSPVKDFLFGIDCTQRNVGVTRSQVRSEAQDDGIDPTIVIIEVAIGDMVQAQGHKRRVDPQPQTRDRIEIQS